jgi:hypothetical protein
MLAGINTNNPTDQIPFKGESSYNFRTGSVTATRWIDSFIGRATHALLKGPLTGSAYSEVEVEVEGSPRTYRLIDPTKGTRCLLSHATCEGARVRVWDTASATNEARPLTEGARILPHAILYNPLEGRVVKVSYYFDIRYNMTYSPLSPRGPLLTPEGWKGVAEIGHDVLRYENGKTYLTAKGATQWHLVEQGINQLWSV